jgi:hypothetical protein
MSYVRFSSSQRPQLRLRGPAFLAVLLFFGLVRVGETWAKTSKSMPRSGSPDTLQSVSSSKKQKSSPRKSRRHRRLKISRSLKPMPALSEAPFSADVSLL